MWPQGENIWKPCPYVLVWTANPHTLCIDDAIALKASSLWLHNSVTSHNNNKNNHNNGELHAYVRAAEDIEPQRAFSFCLLLLFWWISSSTYRPGIWTKVCWVVYNGLQTLQICKYSCNKLVLKHTNELTVSKSGVPWTLSQKCHLNNLTNPHCTCMYWAVHTFWSFVFKKLHLEKSSWNFVISNFNTSTYCRMSFQSFRRPWEIVGLFGKMDVELGWWWCRNRGCLCVLYALSGAQVVVGGSSWRYLLVIGQLLLQLLGFLPHGRQEVSRWLARRRWFLHVIVQTLPHSEDEEKGKELYLFIFIFLSSCRLSLRVKEQVHILFWNGGKKKKICCINPCDAVWVNVI